MVEIAMPDPRAAERRFYVAMSLAILAAVVAGFWRTFLFKAWFPELAPMIPTESFFHLHGALFMAWIVLLVVQPSLVAARRLDLHRRLGWAGAALAVAMVVVGVEGALIAARRPAGFLGIPPPAAAFLIVPIVDIALFALFVALAVLWRNRPQSHKRLMLLASLNLLTASVARWPVDAILEIGPPAFFGLTDLFLVPIAVRDFRTLGRLHPVTLWGGLVLVASQPLRLLASGTAPWLRFAEWWIG